MIGMYIIAYIVWFFITRLVISYINAKWHMGLEVSHDMNPPIMVGIAMPFFGELFILVGAPILLLTVLFLLPSLLGDKFGRM